MTLQIPVNVNNILNQKRLPLFRVLLRCMHIKRYRHLAIHFRQLLQNSNV